MIARWIARRHRAAHQEWVYQSKCARLLSATPLAGHAEHYAARSRRRLMRWERLAFMVSRSGKAEA